MADAIIFRIGEIKRLNHIISSDSSFTVDAVSMTIYDATGAAVVNAASGSVDNASANTEHEIYYLWNTAGRSAGDYTYLLNYTVGAETLSIRGEVTLLPLFSKFDRWVQQVQSIIQETPIAEDKALLSYRDYLTAIGNALKAYQRDHAQETYEDVALTAGQFEYDLFTNWVKRFSVVSEIEYPVNDADQFKYYLCPRDYTIDETRGKWRFERYIPSNGETARAYYTTTHTLSHTADTVPTQDFEAVALYAAGQALMILANKAAQKSSASMGADVANYRTRQQEYRQQAQEMLKLAESTWGEGAISNAVVSWDYLPNAGRIYYR